MKEHIGDILFLAVMVLLGGCSNPPDWTRELLACDVVNVRGPAAQQLSLHKLEYRYFDMVRADIVDTFVISHNSGGEKLYSISSINTGDIVGSYCRRGRGDNEMVASSPFNTYFVEDGDLKTIVIAYHTSRALTWNISESIRTGMDCYESGTILGGEPRLSIVRSSSYLGHDEFVVLKDNQTDDFGDLSDVPRFEKYSLSDGSSLGVVDKMFKLGNVANRHRELTPDNYLIGQSAYVGDRAVYSMYFAPYVIFSDFTERESFCVSTKASFRFSDTTPYVYYVSIACDDNHVYALYSGLKLSEEDDRKNTEMHVFCWDGKFVGRYELKFNFNQIHSNSHFLYFSHAASGEIMYIDKEELNIIQTTCEGRQRPKVQSLQ